MSEFRFQEDMDTFEKVAFLNNMLDNIKTRGRKPKWLCKLEDYLIENNYMVTSPNNWNIKIKKKTTIQVIKYLFNERFEDAGLINNIFYEVFYDIPVNEETKRQMFISFSVN